jgi:hypothetical protein
MVRKSMNRIYDIMSMTARPAAAIKTVVGRKKLYPVRLTLPLTEAAAADIDSARGEQPRVDFIRQAIEREIKRRRSRSGGKPKKS